MSVSTHNVPEQEHSVVDQWTDGSDTDVLDFCA